MWYDLDSQAIASSLSTTHQPAFSPELETTEATNAKLMRSDKSFIARDLNNQPILAYFPSVLDPITADTTYRALDQYLATVPFSLENEPDLPADSKRDQRHPFSKKLFDLFGIRHGIRHCGMWHSTGHPYEPPSVSRDVLRTATLFRAASLLYQRLVSLTVELSILFSAFDPQAWSAARQFIAALQHFHPDFRTCRAGDFECWAHRALLFNLDTHAHRDLRDHRFGYAVIAVFGTFSGGEFVVPELKLKFPFQPGDVIFIKGQMLQHFVTPWSPRGVKGERFCITHFTHQALVDSVHREVASQVVGDVAQPVQSKVSGKRKRS